MIEPHVDPKDRYPDGTEPDVVLPKQWLHWAKLAGLAPSRSRTYARGVRKLGFYLRGRAHNWRVNCFGMFQIGDRIDDWDKWARSHTVQVPMPTNEKDFLEAVRKLRALWYETREQEEQ